MFWLLFYCINGQLIREMFDQEMQYYIHTESRSTIFTLPKAWDGYIQGTGCEVKQKQIQETVSLYEILTYDENQTEFETLTHISHDDQLIAIMTSDLRLVVIYKNNYQSKIFFDLSSYDIQEIHQIIVHKTFILVITNQNAFIIYLSPMSVVYMKDWITRQERWLSGIYGDFIFSAVGYNGLDVYHLSNLTYYRNINSVDLRQNNLCVRDFTLLNETLYLLDCYRGLMIVQITMIQNSMDFKVRNIDIQEGGIAIDTKNGINIFVGYQWKLRHAIVEYVVDEQDWRIQNLIYASTIKDVDVNNDYAIVQGHGRHMVAFNYGTQLSNNILKFKVRDFELFNNEILGITTNSLLRSYLHTIPLSVECSLDKETQFNLIYNVSYNGSEIERHHLHFTVKLLSTYFYKNQSYLVVLLGALLSCIVLLMIFLILKWYFDLRKEERKFIIAYKWKNKYIIKYQTSITIQLTFDYYQQRMILFLIIQIAQQLVIDETQILRYSNHLQIQLPNAIEAKLTPQNDQCQLFHPMIQSNLTLYKIIEDNIINIDFLDETEFYFHQFVAIVQSKENEFYVISDNLKLYVIDLKQKISTHIIDVRDYLSPNYDVKFIKDKYNNIFIHQQDLLHLVRIDSITTYQLISRNQRSSIIYHPYNYFLVSVGSNSIDIYQIEYASDNKILINYHSNTLQLNFNVIGISYHYLDEKTLYLLDTQLGIIITQFNEEGQLILDSQHPITIQNPQYILVTENQIIIASENLLQKYSKRNFNLIHTQKLNNIQQLELSDDDEDLIILGYNKHFISDLEWKFFGLHGLILKKNQVVAITGTNFYIGSIFRLPYRIICSPTNKASQVEYTLLYKTKLEEHSQQLIIQQIENNEIDPIVQTLLCICFVLAILALFVCLYVQKMKQVHLYHERVKRKLENQQHTRITNNSQMF